MRPAALSVEGSTLSRSSSNGAPQAHFQQGCRDDLEVLAPRAADLDLSSGDGGHDSPAPGFDVVPAKGVRSASDPLGALDLEGGGPFPFDMNSHGAEKPAQLHDMRFGRRVPNLRASSRRSGGKQRGLSAGDRGLLEVHRGTSEPVGGGEGMARLTEHFRSHVDECLNVRRDRSPGREIPAGPGEPRRAAAREQRSKEEHRAAQPADQIRVGFVRPDLAATYSQRRCAEPLHRCAQALEQCSQHLDVPDARHVVKHALLVGEKAGGKQRQRRILVAVDRELSGKAASAFDNQRAHWKKR